MSISSTQRASTWTVCNGLWFSRSDNDEPNDRGVGRIKLALGDPVGSDGTFPTTLPVKRLQNFGAEDLVVRESPPTGPLQNCHFNPPGTIHAMSTYYESDLVCRVALDHNVDPAIGDPCELCGVCGEAFPNSPPLAIDVIRDAAFGFGPVDDVVFSRETGPGQVDFVRASSIEQCLSTLAAPFAVSSAVDRIWGMAIGDFRNPNGPSGPPGIYYVAQMSQDPTNRTIRRLESNTTDSVFCSLPTPNRARTIEFDPSTGDLFVSEDAEIGQDHPDQARIWRIDKTGSCTLFGKNFNKPNGMTFHPAGALLVGEETPGSSLAGNILVVTGARSLFIRGDANGDGTVDISDPVTIFSYLQKTGSMPSCFDAADTDNNSHIAWVDGQIIINFLYNGGAQPDPPFPNPGRDPLSPIDLFDCGKSPSAIDCVTNTCTGCSN